MLMAVVFAFSASAQLSRESGEAATAKEQKAGVSAPRMQLSPEMLRKSPKSQVQATGAKSLKTVQSAVPVRRQTKRATQAVPKAVGTSQVSGIQGFMSYNGGYGDTGWYELGIPTSTLKWKNSMRIVVTGGFVREGLVWCFGYYATSSEGVVEAGFYRANPLTGEVVDGKALEDLFETYEHVVQCMTYDPDADVAYAITYNKTGSNYLFQKYDPKTDTFTNLGVSPGTDWLALGYNPADKCVYLLCDNGQMKRYDSGSMKFVNVTSYNSYNLTEAPNAMIYSPKDKAFFALIDTWEEDDYQGEVYNTDAVLLYTNGTSKYVGGLQNNDQYRILYTADEYVNPTAAAAPKVKSWSVDGPALTGTLTLTLPSALADGTPISGTVYMEVAIDGTSVGSTLRGPAGSDVDIQLNVAEGLHTVTATPILLGDDGKEYGNTLTVRRYFGYDTPKAPTGVKLTDKAVTWQAVTAGVNDGYIDASAVTYNVMIDGVKMNDAPVAGTSLAITIPASSIAAHRAEVTAIAAGKESDPGVSGRFYSDGAFNIPVTFGTEPGEVDMDRELIGMFTIVNNPLNQDKKSLRGWRYDDQAEKTGGFYCLCPLASDKGDYANEYLFLPPVNFTNKDAFYRFSVDLWSANHSFTKDEDYEIVIAQRPSGTRATVIREKSTIHKAKDFELSETLFQVPEEGEWYIGIHYISPLDNYRLYARNFRIEEVNASNASPAAVSDLKATAKERGELKAIVTFKMPEVSISGDALDAATTITATASSTVGEVSATGKPGQAMSIEVPTKQGDNTIQVATSSDQGVGRVAEALVYCGVYAPSSPIVGQTSSDDNQHVTLEIFIDDYNEKGQFAGPDDCLATVYRQIGNSWREVAELGKGRTWTFDCPDPSIQDSYMLAVGVRNDAGSCEYLTSIGVNLGKLYTLPMKETWPENGNSIDFMEPVRIENISYYNNQWSFVNPAEIDPTYANESGIALCAMWAAESQIVLPRFSTTGLNNVKFDLSTYFGNITPDYIAVYATSPAIEMEPIGMFTRTDGNGWEHKLLTLPAKCQNQPWVEITVRVKMDTYSQYFLLDSYSIANYPDQMATITSMKGPQRAVVGEPLTYEVEIENSGVAEMNLPDYQFDILGSNGIVASDLKAADAPAAIASRKKCKLHFTITPKQTHIGNLAARFSMSGQPASAVTEAEVKTRLLNAPIPTVNDFAGGLDKDTKNVTLSWSTPTHIESFEAFEPWAYDEEMRGFRNIDVDGSPVLAISELNQPGKSFAKAYQVFSSANIENPYLKAHTGEHFLAVMSAKSGASNDWLISPEVKGGTEMSFWANLLSDGYPETILVKYSSTGNDIANFKDLPDGYICPDEAGWQQHTVQLPADAKYFALHHVGDDGSAQWGIFIDDIAFEPATDPAPVEGYNVYRDDQLIASNLTTPGYVDTNVDLSIPVRYYVKTLSTVGGEKMESDRSNVIWMDEESGSGLEDIDACAAKIFAGKGIVKMNGYAAGTHFSIATLQGAVVADGEIATDSDSVALQSGVYLVRCGADVAKVMVK